MLQIDVSGIDKLLRRISNYKDGIETKKKIFLERLGDLGVEKAIVKFQDAQYDGTNDVVVERATWIDDNTIAVRATGSSVLFIEFGSGRIGYGHEKPLKYGPGTWSEGPNGKHLWNKEKGWIYKGEKGTGGLPVLTRDKDGKVTGTREGVWRSFGNPPARAMYNASKEIKEQYLRIAREVFDRD